MLRPMSDPPMGSTLGEIIRRQRELQELSMRQFAQMVGISNPYLSQIERGLRKPSAEILSQIAGALQISGESLYERAGLIDPEGTPRGGVRDAVANDPKLTPEQRQAMLNVYESFLAANG